MSAQWRDYIKQLQTILKETDYVKPNSIPGIDLYMDQVTTFMDEHLEPSKRFESDKLLTKTMINNYTKNDLLPPPVKKKYSKDHMYLLIFIYYLKNFLSIKDVKTVISPMSKMFFGNDASISLEDIYSSIVEVEENSAYDIAKDVMRKFLKSRKAFPKIESEEEREYLQIFLFISMLSFDVYLKKNLIESIIDDVLSDDKAADRKTTEKNSSDKKTVEKNSSDKKKTESEPAEKNKK